MQSIFEKASLGRSLIYEGKADDAISVLSECFKSEPNAWWLLMEVCRLKRTGNTPKVPTTSKTNKELEIFFAPNYEGNSYQNILYSCSSEYRARTIPLNNLGVESVIETSKSNKKVIFHQHWLREIYRNCKDFEDGINRVDRYVGYLKILKAFGIPIIWTVHNLIDHDLEDYEKRVCAYAVRAIANASDLILLHAESSRAPLLALSEQNITEKCFVIEHPLYSEMSSINTPGLPKEIKLDYFMGKKLFLCLGMIRPYKGVSELLDVYTEIVQQEKAGDSCLVIAGRMNDENVRQKIEYLKRLHPDRIYSVPRVLSDAEVSALYSIADVAVMPYRAILISGSYYLATTFSVPSIAPNIGMFQDVINDEITGLKYDNHIEGLRGALSKVIRMKKEELKFIGANAYEASKHQTSDWFSQQYFDKLCELKLLDCSN